MPALTNLLKDMGVKFSWNTSVYGWRSEAGRITALSTTTGDHFADEYVLAGGSWSPQMLNGLGLRLPMQAGKGYSLTLAKPRFQLAKSLILTERRVAVTPMGDTPAFRRHDGDQRPQQQRPARARGADHRRGAGLLSGAHGGRLRRHQTLVRLPAGHTRRHALHRSARSLLQPRHRERARHARADPGARLRPAYRGNPHRPQTLGRSHLAQPPIATHELERRPPGHHDQSQLRPHGRPHGAWRALPLDDRQRLHRHRGLRLARRGGDAQL